MAGNAGKAIFYHMKVMFSGKIAVVQRIAVNMARKALSRIIQVYTIGVPVRRPGGVRCPGN
jgi:hypothetical protein